MKPQLIKEWHTFKQYLYKNRWMLVISGIIFCLIYGGWMFNMAPHIDTEPVINVPRAIYDNWLPIGRYGLVFTEYVFGLRWFNPFVSTGLGYAVLWFSGILFSYIFERCAGSSISISPIVSLLIFVSPLVVEQLYFDLQLFQVAWAYCLCAIATGLTYYGSAYRSKAAKIIAIACLVWTSSSYQIFVIMYVAAVVICFVLLCERYAFIEKRSCEIKYWLKLIVYLLLIFGVAQLLNTLIFRLCFQPDTGYLDGQRMWGVLSTAECIKNIIAHIVKAFSGIGVFYTCFLGISAVFCVAIALYRMVTSRPKHIGILLLLAMCFLQLTPFLMTIYMGAEPAPRSQLVYSFVLTGNTFFILRNCWRKRRLKIIGIAGLLVLLLQEGNWGTRLIYTDRISAQEDMRLAYAIESKIADITTEIKPLAFVGVYSNQLNNACVRGQLIGMSIFNCNSEVEPHYHGSTSRICNLSKNMSFDFQPCTVEQLAEARKQALNMPIWPAQGSVADAGEYIIVKLSEDRWPEEVMSADAKKASAPTVTENLQAAVDSAEIADGKLQINGWVIQQGTDSSDVLPEAYLRSKTTGEYFQISAARVERPDLVNAFENGHLYECGGYKAMVLLDEISDSIDNYDLLIGISDTKSGTHYAVETGYQWPSDIVTESKAKK